MASSNLKEEEAGALKDLQKRVFGFTQLATIRCAIELGIPDIVENHPEGVTLPELSSALGCSPLSLHRIMRFLSHKGIFKQVKTHHLNSPIAYIQTTLSRLLMKNNMAPLLLLASNPEVLASKLSMSKFLVSKNNDLSAFEVANGANVWQYTAANPSYNELFNKSMTCLSKPVISALIENHRVVFQGIGCLVDVGGGNGTTLRTVVKACPWIIRAVNFDLPHVVSSLDNDDDCVEHVAGDMFQSVPSADALLLVSVLLDWNDEACVKILKNCKQAMPRESGKVIIVDVVMDDDDNFTEDNNEYRDYHLALDIEIMCYTLGGKGRTSKEWIDILNTAGFIKHTFTRIPAPYSVIEAYP